MKKSSLISILILSGFLTSDKVYSRVSAMQRNYVPSKGCVPDAATAQKVAEAIWLPIYGDEIYSEKPYKVNLVNDKVWIVEGTLPKGYLGGVTHIEIQKSDCKILKVIHGK